MPVVLMSAVSSAVYVPGVPFVAKPFDLDALLSVIARAVTARTSEGVDRGFAPFRARKWPRA
jgi:hypothetical protein